MNDILKIKNGDLYALLAVCSQEDLNPLVESITKRFDSLLKNITDKFSNSIETNTRYKRHYPNHKEYTDLIADEIRLYGGNSISNMYRQRTGPNYDEILFDVCQKLDIPSEKSEIIKNEKRLLKLCFSDNWENLSLIEQERILAKAKKDYKTYGGLVTSGAGIATRVVSTPISAGLLTKGLTDPAFTVTIPCVLQIAYLRWKVLNRITKDTTQKNNPYKNSNNQLVTQSDSSLVIKSDSENPLITFSLVDVPQNTNLNWQQISESDNTGISRFNSLLQAVPNLVTKAHIATTQYLKSDIPLESLTLAKGSTNEYRGYTRDLKGQFEKHAKLTSVDDLTNIVNAAALFQIASVIVAQKHLADINQKLTEIKKAVDDIHTHQQDKREANMTGAIDYFKQIAPSVLAGKSDEVYRHKIEDCEKELLSINNHLIKDIEKLNFEITELKDSDTFGSEGMKKVIEAHQNKIFNTYEQLLLCIKARSCGWQLLLAHPETEQISKDRKNGIDESITLLDVNGKLLNTTVVEMGKKIRSLKAVTNTEQTLNKRKLDLLERQDALINKITTTTHEIKTRIDSISSLVEDKNENISFLLKIENEKVVACTPL